VLVREPALSQTNLWAMGYWPISFLRRGDYPSAEEVHSEYYEYPRQRAEQTLAPGLTSKIKPTSLSAPARKTSRQFPSSGGVGRTVRPPARRSGRPEQTLAPGLTSKIKPTSSLAPAARKTSQPLPSSGTVRQPASSGSAGAPESRTAAPSGKRPPPEARLGPASAQQAVLPKAQTVSPSCNQPGPPQARPRPAGAQQVVAPKAHTAPPISGNQPAPQARLAGLGPAGSQQVVLPKAHMTSLSGKKPGPLQAATSKAHQVAIRSGPPPTGGSGAGLENKAK
jgi:hypothetical protein